MIRITDDITLADGEFEERFVRASGPGGQNVNKVATAVQLRFNVLASSLPQEVKDRLTMLAANRINSNGELIIDGREHRTQAANREAARERFVALLRQAAKRKRKRKKTKPTAAAREQRLTEKKRRGELKSRRRTEGDEP